MATKYGLRYLNDLGLRLPDAITNRIDFLFKAQTNDPVLRLAHKLGFEVTMYQPRHTPWDQFIKHLGPAEALLGFLGALFYINRASTGNVRKITGLTGIVLLLLWVPVYGRTNIGIIDFGLPALAFLATLHLIDIFFLREPSETANWSFARMYCEIFAFPKEEQSANPRWENFKALKWSLAKGVLVNLLLYAVPPPQYLPQITSWTAWSLYHAVIGYVVLSVLGAVIEGILRLEGIIFGVEMGYMFDNPLYSSNLREFWAKWDLPVKQGLHTVIFHAKAKKQKEKRAAASKAPNGGPARRRHNDALSETDMSAAEDSPIAKKRAAAQKAKPSPKKSSGKFMAKAGAAFATFMFSGAFHELMNAMAFDGASGETMAFFAAHAVGCIAYTWIQRNIPALPNNTPWMVGFFIVLLFGWATAQLFCAPFGRAGFFEDFKAIGLFGPIRGFVWVFGH